MKRKLFAMFLIVTLMLPCAALCEEEKIETPLDRAYDDFYSMIEIDNLPVVISVNTIPTDDQGKLQLLGVMLVDLYDYETRVLGKSADESIAVDIYRGLQKEAGIVCMTAVNQDAVLVNGLIGKNKGDTAFADEYWFEYNIEENTMRVLYDVTIEKCADAEDFLSEYIFANHILWSVNANPLITVGMPQNSIYGFYDGKNMKSFFDAVYESLYHTAPNL